MDEILAQNGRDKTGIQRIEKDGRLIAIVIRKEFHQPGINFLTDAEASMQLGTLGHLKSKIIEPHVHRFVPRENNITQEVLVIRAGKIRADFYDNDENYMESRILREGDILLLVSGGHGFEMLEDTDMVEVKTGPYLAEDDKRRFGPSRPKHLKIID